MKDSVILGSGNSRYLKSVADFKTLYPTYDDFAAALVAGTLPIDLNGINAAGFQQIGDALGKATLLTDALNKYNLLKDVTAALYGLPNTAVPDDVLALLKTLVDNAQTSANNKARIAVGSYVGTGTYGESRPNSLTFDFIPSVLVMLAYKKSGKFYPIKPKYDYLYTNTFPCDILSGTGFVSYPFAEYASFGNYTSQGYIARTSDKKTLKWYANLYINSDNLTDSSKEQYNEANVEYFYIALGHE